MYLAHAKCTLPVRLYTDNQIRGREEEHIRLKKTNKQKNTVEEFTDLGLQTGDNGRNWIWFKDENMEYLHDGVTTHEEKL